MIEETVNQVLLAKSFEPAQQREKEFQKRAATMALKAQDGLEALTLRVEKHEVATKKRLQAVEATAAKMQVDLDKAVATIQAQLARLQLSTEGNSSVQRGETAKLREDMQQAVAKERTRRLKLFTRWNDKHALDVQSINDRLERELSYLAQRSSHEFGLQSATLETLKDKLDYALMKRYGFVPDTRGGPGSAEYSLEGDEREHASSGHGHGNAAPSPAASDHAVLQRPLLRGVFNLCADAAGVVSSLDSRIDSLSSKVACMQQHAQQLGEAQGQQRVRRRHVRNDESSLGSASSSNYGDDSHDWNR